MVNGSILAAIVGPVVYLPGGSNDDDNPRRSFILWDFVARWPCPSSWAAHFQISRRLASTRTALFCPLCEWAVVCVCLCFHAPCNVHAWRGVRAHKTRPMRTTRTTMHVFNMQLSSTPSRWLLPLILQFFNTGVQLVDAPLQGNDPLPHPPATASIRCVSLLPACQLSHLLLQRVHPVLQASPCLQLSYCIRHGLSAIEQASHFTTGK